MRTTLSSLLLLSFAACAAPSGPTATPQGTAMVSVALSNTDVSTVSINVSPAGLTQTLNKQTNSFTGKLVLPVGHQTISATATGYSGQVIGTGTADVEVKPNLTSALSLTIVGTPLGQSGIAPIITRLTVADLQPLINQPVQVAAAAVDLDGDALAYAWSSDCADGAFADATQPSTTWSRPTQGACTLTLTVTANGQSTTQQVTVAVLASAGQGVVDITGTFVQTSITSVNFCDQNICQYLPRTGGEANVTALFPAGATAAVSLYVDQPDPAQVATISDTCGGTYWWQVTGMPGYYAFTWQAPATPGVACKITIALQTPTQHDQYSFGLLLGDPRPEGPSGPTGPSGATGPSGPTGP